MQKNLGVRVRIVCESEPHFSSAPGEDARRSNVEQNVQLTS